MIGEDFPRETKRRAERFVGKAMRTAAEVIKVTGEEEELISCVSDTRQGGKIGYGSDPDQSIGFRIVRISNFYQSEHIRVGFGSDEYFGLIRFRIDNIILKSESNVLSAHLTIFDGSV